MIFQRAGLLLLLNLFLLSCSINSATADDFNVNEEGVALHGYDPVAYFNSTPKKGSSRITASHANAVFYFATQENLKQFQSNPDKYTPQFGGYCSYGVRMGKKLDIDPESYAVRKNQLYLLLNRSTKELWDKDRGRNIAIADRLWPSINPVPASKLNSAK
jgi:YHS domain-containing protein